MLKTTILALQSALETSLHEKNTLINHNNALQSRLSTSVTAINFAKFLQKNSEELKNIKNNISDNNNDNQELELELELVRPYQKA